MLNWGTVCVPGNGTHVRLGRYLHCDSQIEQQLIEIRGVELGRTGRASVSPPIFIVDDDPAVRDSLATLLESSGFRTESFESATKFLASGGAARRGCLIADIRMPDMDGLALQEELARRSAMLAVIIVTGHGDVPLAVRAMKAGAVDFLEKPFDEESLLTSVRRAAELISSAGTRIAAFEDAQTRLADLTRREREVLELVVAGRANKVIAHELGISPRTVELHRARVMDKMNARTVADLVRITLQVDQAGRDPC
jgi:two-component system response regulator FixJ